MAHTFYSKGLRFSCRRCSCCCRIDPGFVFLSQTDIPKILAKLNVSYDDFIKTYCRWIPFPDGEHASLREKENYDCIFWENGGCIMYEARPFQCRSFPFWLSTLRSKEDWDAHALDCPGMNTGTLFTESEIEGWLSERRSQRYITKERKT
jgi:uncharacterized protein